MKYLVNLVTVLLMYVVAFVVTPILPLFASSQLGRSLNGTVYLVEPRLPQWLSWFDTPDNSLLGDTQFRQLNPETYWSKVRWLYRNSLYGFKWTVLSLPEGHPSAWQWHRKFYFKTFYLDLNFGWMLDNIERGRAMFMFSPRIKRIPND